MSEQETCPWCGGVLLHDDETAPAGPDATMHTSCFTEWQEAKQQEQVVSAARGRLEHYLKARNAHARPDREAIKIVLADHARRSPRGGS